MESSADSAAKEASLLAAQAELEAKAKELEELKQRAIMENKAAEF